MATSATDALYQQYIAAGMSPEDARTMADFDLAKYQADYQAQQQFIANAPKYEVPGAYDYTTQYGGMDIIPGMTSGILARLGIQNPIVPVYQLLGSENDGNPLNAEERMQFIATPGATYRLKNNETGEIVGTASTPEEISSLVQQSNALSQQLGNSANLTVERSNPEALGGGYTEMFTDTPDKVMNTLTKLALAGMIVATGAGLLQPGGLGGLGATGATAAGTTAVPAATTAATTAALAPAAAATLGPEIVATAILGGGSLTAAQAAALASLAGLGTTLGVTGGATGATGTTAGTTAGSTAAAGSILPETVVTAITGGGKALSAAELAALAAMGAGAGAIIPSTAGATTGTTTGANSATNAGTGAGADTIVVTGTTPTNLLPPALATGAAATAAAAANSMGATTSAADTAATRTTPTAAETAALNAGAGAGGVFGTGLNLAQLASITGIGVDLLGNLLGGGGGGAAGATTPYVSPFGGDVGIGPLASRTQVNPNIADYERYGFGPEALFFSGGQTSSGATTGSTTGGTASPVTTTTTTPDGKIVVTQGDTTGVRPAGFTGTMANQKVGDTQVVDGKTYVWGGNDKGWQWQATNNAGSTVLMPSGGATNVTPTEDMFKSGLMRQLTPEETLQATALERAVAAAPTAAAATKLNPGSVYFDIDQRTADALGDRGLIGDVMSIQQLQQAMAARELTDPNKYATNLYNQIGQQLSGGLLNIDQARAIQNQIQQQLVSSPNVTTQSLQSIYDTNMQQYKPLI